MLRFAIRVSVRARLRLRVSVLIKGRDKGRVIGGPESGFIGSKSGLVFTRSGSRSRLGARVLSRHV